MQHFFINPASLQPQDGGFADRIAITESDLIHQVSKVLRMRAGSKIALLDNSGNEFIVELLKFESKTIHARLIEMRKNEAEAAIAITLFQAIPKSPAKFEEVLKHATEIGVVKFIPLISERVEVEGIRNRERLEKIIREAAEQSERGKLPLLAEAVKWSDLWKNPPADLNLIADSYSATPRLQDFFPALRERKAVNLFIGPEGGFSEAEIKLAKAADGRNFSLGKRILRSETAGVAIASAILFG
ncbi:MAG: RsmE family RNA methyltransferase [Candidatus Gracilibacteria bacterium]|nr:RsmE family RNA methyltransferase [Candidatus Gracilibacteria bacterium]MDD5179136.1 RsmE family RNA methyltransferase [Candidatus Gracilibacteria bacterium]